tara:strand:+ start:883 stop:1716 length:834 start_codon:yes stop_codon:yes gene_type:complete
MIEEIKYFILGLIQGLTEFFPISSSGHLELFSHIYNIAKSEPLLLFITVHFATALSTVIVYYQRIREIVSGLFLNTDKDRSFVLKLLISSIPTIIIYVLFQHKIDLLFIDAVSLVCAMLIITGLILLSTSLIKTSNGDINFVHAILIGCAQAFAIIPGISRSGATIATALCCKVKRERAAEFSFLMALIPIIGGTIIKGLEFLTKHPDNDIEIKGLIIAFLSAFFSGLFACKYMIFVVKKNNLKYFGYYCVSIGLLFWFTTSDLTINHLYQRIIHLF